MNLPPWKSDDPKDQAALARFIIAELDRANEGAAIAANSDTAMVDVLQSYHELRRLASAQGLRIEAPFRTPKRGRGRPGKDAASNEFTDFDRAALDVPRIRALFVEHWGKRNRMTRPLAEEIAAERWKLSPEQGAALIDMFQRKI